MPACDGISKQIEVLQEERESILQELNTAPPSMKAGLLRDLRAINTELARLRQQLLLCQNPPAPRPDLAARTVQLHVNHATRKLGVAALIKNVGRGVASGPFRIDLAATLYRGGVTTSFVQVFEVPAGVVLYPEMVNAPPNAAASLAQQEDGQRAAEIAAQLAAFRVPGWPGEIFSQEYVTEDMVVPLYYRDESPSAIYEFEFIVDSERQVAEADESNNHFFVRWWTTQPQSVQRSEPFEVQMEADRTEQRLGYREGSLPPAD